jgi:hypothetical protein
VGNQYNWKSGFEFEGKIVLLDDFDFESFKRTMIRYRNDRYHRSIEFLFKGTYKIKIEKDNKLRVYSVYDVRYRGYRGESLNCPANNRWSRRKYSPFCFHCAEANYNCSGKNKCKLIEAKEICAWGKVIERDKKLKELLESIMAYFTKERILNHDNS